VYPCYMLLSNLDTPLQSLHEAHATADPSDLAAIASHILFSNTQALNAFRVKLKHIILDEYQDVSVTQHSLIRLIVRGVIEETDDSDSLAASMLTLPPVLDSYKPTSENADVCFQVAQPHTFP
jgi:superfamily I DNA/RNA helicase